MKKFTALLLVLLLTFSACSMSLAEDGKKTLSLIRLGDLVKAEPIFAPIIEGFEEEYSDYTVDFSAMSWNEATTKLKLLGAQQQLPDVLFINIINGWDLASEGYLADLSELVAQDPVLSEELPPVRAGHRHHGGRKAVLGACRHRRVRPVVQQGAL